MGLLPALINTMSQDRPECRCVRNDDIKCETAKVDDPIKRWQIS